MARRLGRNQAAVLNALQRHGRWHAGCGWIWGSWRQTTKIMDRLVELGYATKEEEADRTFYHPASNASMTIQELDAEIAKRDAKVGWTNRMVVLIPSLAKSVHHDIKRYDRACFSVADWYMIEETYQRI